MTDLRFQLESIETRHRGNVGVSLFNAQQMLWQTGAVPRTVVTGGGPLMIQYMAGYKFVGGGVHAQVLDFPEAITCGADLDEARRLLGSALIDVAEVRLELGEPLPLPDSMATDPDMDLEEPIFLHLSASSAVLHEPAGVVVP